MSRLRIRTLSILGLILILTLPWLFFLAAHLMVTGSLQLGGNGSPDSYGVQMGAAIAGLAAAFLFVGIAMRRHMLKPLEQMSLAARQLADGDWEVRLPESGVAEIAEVRDGFVAMVEGLQASYRNQAALEEERRFVIAAVAHDLRTPLFALRGYLDGLEQGIAQTPEKAAKYVAVCKEKSAQLDRLVEDLFTFTKVEYLNAELRQETVDLKRILQQSMDSFRPLCEQQGITMISDLPANDCFVFGEAHLLERALGNLLDNAVRHAYAGGRIFVSCGHDGRKATFAVRDTGQGFSPEELPRVFEALYRGEASRNRATGGGGLGLTISRRIIRRHGGDLTAANDPEGGALLSGWLPALMPSGSR